MEYPSIFKAGTKSNLSQILVYILEAFSDYITNNGGHANPYDSMGEYLENIEDYEAAHDYYMMAYTVDSTFAVSKERAEEVKKKILGK